MVNALWITLIGMGLVFVAILLLWGLMALLVRITEEREEPQPADQPIGEPGPQETSPSLLERKRRAAAVAVAVALSRRKPAHSQGAAQPAGTLSAWQAVQRANQFSQRVSSSRKKVVR